MVRRAIATLCLLAPIAVQAQELVIVYRSDHEFKFRWAPASGPVASYEVCIDYTWTRACYGCILNEFTFEPLEWYPWFVQVRALDADFNTGEWSPPSIVYSLNPNRADINLDGAVGLPDYGILMQEWGKAP